MRGYWYHLATSMDFSTTNAFRAHFTFHVPENSTNLGARSQIDWTGTTNIPSYVFQATDYITLRFSGNDDYPAIDCTFNAAFAMPYFFNNAGYRFVFGSHEGIILLIQENSVHAPLIFA